MAFLTAARVDFQTPKKTPLGHGSKSASTGIEMHLYDSGAIERLSCPTNTAYGTEFKDDGSVQSIYFDMTSIVPGDYQPTPEDFRFCGLTIYAWHDGDDDTWIFKPAVVLTYDDGTEVRLQPKNKVWRTNKATGPITAEFYGK
jgi:hypothetical protein